MAERKGQPEQTRLPIKVVLPRQGRERSVPRGGARPKPFLSVDGDFRQHLGNQVVALRRAIVPAARQTGSVPIRVKLHHRALAKSHRPETLFSEETCPIVGAGRLGELFLKATPRGLSKLADWVERRDSSQFVKELSTVAAIEPVTAEFRRGGQSSHDILRHSPRRGRGFITRVRLFDFREDTDFREEVDFRKETDQERLYDGLIQVCEERGINIDTGGYSPQSFVFETECRSVDDVDALANVVGVRSVAQMPILRVIRSGLLKPDKLPTMLPSPRERLQDMPVVVVVDSGISDALTELDNWVIGRDSSVPPRYRNSEHGTFVAGLICWGDHLNPNIGGIESSPCAIFDLQVLPNDDPAKGDTDTVSESEFLQSLETTLRKHANEYKVWNLSLSTNSVCSLGAFSPMAVELDNLQEQYQVSFVISAGNYDSVPRLNYPRSKTELDSGRITSPADSALGITVGSVSHVDYKVNGPKEHHPSAFSRHGAGPNHIIKPDLVHYGGSCSLDASHQAGVRSIAGRGTAEDLGTSFSTPLVSRTLANIYHEITPIPSPVLARALLTHGARDPRTDERVPDGEENYFGFGLPANLPNCLGCTPYSSTLVFEDVLRPGYYLEWDDFPYPPSLHRGGRYFGEIWMTVAFAPNRGERWGSEYCETHIEAHMGVYQNQKSRKTGQIKRKFKGLVPPEHKNPGKLYESHRVESLRKWAPVRTYHGSLGPRGQRGDQWRLMVRLLTRHRIEAQKAFRPQPFSLILTVADPQAKALVYDEMLRIIRNRFRTQNLTLRSRTRMRTRGRR